MYIHVCILYMCIIYYMWYRLWPVGGYQHSACQFRKLSISQLFVLGNSFICGNWLSRICMDLSGLLKFVLPKKSCLYSLGKTQGRPLWCTLYLGGFIIYFANTCLAECTQMFACFCTVWTNLQRRPAIEITSYIFNHMINK